MNKENRYYLKWDVEDRQFLLDTQFIKRELSYTIRSTKITERQAIQYGEHIESKYLNRDKYIDLNVLEFEFDRFFKVCKLCKATTSRVDWVIRQGNMCFECYQANLSEKRKEAFKKYMERVRVKRLQEYSKTDQGIADTVGLEAIRANIKIQLAKHGKSQGDLAKFLGMFDGSVSKLLNDRKSMRIEYIYKIAEWLFVPVDLLLKMPRGTKPLKRKNKIPILIYRKKMRTIRMEKYQLD